MNLSNKEMPYLKSKSPLVSFCMMTYNQEEYIEEALSAALSQNYPNLEIIISDDCSKDKTREIINKVANNYKGEHKVIIDNNHMNLGLASNFNKITSLASGEFIVIAAGDDISLPERTTKSVEFLVNNPDCYIADFHVNFIDANGSITTSKNKKSDLKLDKNDLFKGNIRGVRGCSRVYRKTIFSTFGPLNPDCPTEDSTGVWRALILGQVGILHEKTVLYRKHNLSISNPRNMYKLNINKIIKQYKKDIRKAYDLKLISKSEYQKFLMTALKERRKREIIRARKFFINTIKSLRFKY